MTSEMTTMYLDGYELTEKPMEITLEGTRSHMVQEFFLAVFHILCSSDLHEISKDRIIRISGLW